MSERITRRAEWDGTFSLLLDGEIMMERKPLTVVEEGQAFLELSIGLRLGQFLPVDTAPKA